MAKRNACPREWSETDASLNLLSHAPVNQLNSHLNKPTDNEPDHECKRDPQVDVGVHTFTNPVSFSIASSLSLTNETSVERSPSPMVTL